MTVSRTAGMSPRPARRGIGFVRAALALAAGVVLVAGVVGLSLPGVAAAPAGGASAIWAWGNNDVGELGNGTQVSSSTPVPTSTLASATSIASWGGHNLAVAPDGTVWEWGNTAPGSPTPAQVCSWVVPVAGEPDIRNSKDCHTVPTEVTSLPAGLKATAVATGGWPAVFNLALMADGTVWAWGANNLGQLGFGTTNGSPLGDTENVGGLGPSSGPAPVRRVDGTVLDHIKAIATGGNGSLALADDGSVWTWGEYEDGVAPVDLPGGCAIPEAQADCAAQAVVGPGGVGHLNLGTNGTIAAGYDFDLAISHLHGTTQLWGWGWDQYGQLGTAPPINTTHPALVAAPMPLTIPGGSDVTAVAAPPEGQWAAAVEGDGTVWEWGTGNPTTLAP